MDMKKRPLIPYAGYETRMSSQRNVPVKRAKELRERGMRWRQIALELSVEFDRDLPFTEDAVRAAVRKGKRGLI